MITMFLHLKRFITIKRAITLIVMLFYSSLHANTLSPCSGWPGFAKSSCQRLHQVWTEGDNELYFSGYAWHNRYTYTKERLATYNELAWGGGMGKSLYDEKGNWHGLYAFAFLDSHKNVEPIAGYAYAKVLHFNDTVSLGGGVTAFITARADIFNNIPFPGILPCAFLSFGRATVSAIYIPGAAGAGNVLYITGKWRL